MIAVDTNALVRNWARDDATQANAARALLEGLTSERQGFICREVAIETAWVLERAYKFTRAQVADVLLDMTATDSLAVETEDDVVRAAITYRQGGPDFADLMILAAADRIGAAPLYTFDRELAQVEGAALIETARR